MTLVACLSLALVLPFQESPKPSGIPKAARAIAGTPESALREFLTALALQDEKTLREVVLPTEDFAWLLKGQTPPAGQAEELRAYFSKIPLRVLKPGDTFELKSRTAMKTVKVLPEEVTADRAVLMLEHGIVPSRLQKVAGQWKVDATPVIASRKAASAARERAKSATPKSKSKR
jgi:hypothetical protein